MRGVGVALAPGVPALGVDDGPVGGVVLLGERATPLYCAVMGPTFTFTMPRYSSPSTSVSWAPGMHGAMRSRSVRTAHASVDGHLHVELVGQLHLLQVLLGVHVGRDLPAHGTSVTRSGRSRISPRAPSSPSVGSSGQTSRASRTGGRRPPVVGRRSRRSGRRPRPRPARPPAGPAGCRPGRRRRRRGRLPPRGARPPAARWPGPRPSRGLSSTVTPAGTTVARGPAPPVMTTVSSSPAPTPRPAPRRPAGGPGGRPAAWGRRSGCRRRPRARRRGWSLTAEASGAHGHAAEDRVAVDPDDGGARRGDPLVSVVPAAEDGEATEVDDDRPPARAPRYRRTRRPPRCGSPPPGRHR